MERMEFEVLWRRSEPHVRAFLAAACQDRATVQVKFAPQEDFLGFTNATLVFEVELVEVK